MARSIKLHPRHGLNPTINQCFWCGKDQGGISLLGNAYKGKAPMHMVTNYDPCDTCKTKMERGIWIIECRSADNDHPAMDRINKLAPTGRWWVLTEESFAKWPLLPEVKEATLKKRALMIEAQVAKIIGLYDKEI